MLDTLAAEESDADAAAILSMLHRAARHDEHEVALGGPLRTAGRDALALVMSRAQQAGSQRDATGRPVSGVPTLVSPPPVMTPGTAEAADTEGDCRARNRTGRSVNPVGAGHPVHSCRRAGRGTPGGADLREGGREPGRRVRDRLADRGELMELVANRSVVELELRRALGSRRSNLRNKVLLLRAAPQWRGEAEFPVEVNGSQIPVTVAACPTVLAVLDALGAVPADGRYLVVLTPCDTRDVGDSVLARALQPEIKPINRWDLVQEAFGANQLDPVLAKSAQRLGRRGAARRPAWGRLAPLVWYRSDPGCRAQPAGGDPAVYRPTPTTRRSTRPPCSNGQLTLPRWRASTACVRKSVRV